MKRRLQSWKERLADLRRERLPKGLAYHLRHTLGAGILVAVPLGITLFILRFLFHFADGILAPYIHFFLRQVFGFDFYIPGTGVVFGLITLYLAGLLMTNVMGRYLVHRWDNFLARIPLVKTVYFSARQVMEILSRSRDKQTFRRAVFIDWPTKDSFAVAYVTNESVDASGRREYTCFIPTSPNPTTGFVLVMEESRVYPAEMSVEDAMKIVMSIGMVVPEVLKAKNFQ